MISEWLSAYFKLAEGEVELRALPDKRNGGTPEHVYSRDADVLEAFVRKWDRPGHGVFFGACTRKPATRKAGKVADAYRMPAYWVDIDGTPKDEAIRALAGCRLPPSAIIDSGRGVHGYWLLNRPIDVSEALSNDHEAVGTLKRLAAIFAGDRAVCDLARVMRLPGTHNGKHCDRRPVRVIRWTEARS